MDLGGAVMAEGVTLHDTVIVTLKAPAVAKLRQLYRTHDRLVAAGHEGLQVHNRTGGRAFWSRRELCQRMLECADEIRAVLKEVCGG